MPPASSHSIRLGVTGGIGSGKSTVAALLAREGAALIDADALSRGVTAAGGSAIEPIRAAFGDEMIAGDGALERARMRALAFADAAARERLQAIVHPLVGQAIAQAVGAATRAGTGLIVLDIPLLAESAHWPAQLDAVLVVDCTEATQIARVAARSALAEAQVRAIMATQASRSARRAIADFVIYNEGLALSDLKNQAQSVATALGP